MPKFNVIVMGASSGGIQAIRQVLSGLPNRLNAAVFVVQHLSPDSINLLPDILNRQCPVTVRAAEDGMSIQNGQIHLAPPDRHLLIDADQMHLSRGPRENRVRPAIDPLFRSAALSHGRRVIGVILSGSLDDGSSGLLSIKKAGGRTIVQDPETAITPDMPSNALRYQTPDHCVPADEIGPLLGRLLNDSQDSGNASGLTPRMRSELRKETAVLMRQSGDIKTAEHLGELVAASCPECGGPLWEMTDDVPRFRCHTGHAYTAQHLVAGLEEAEEQSLWVALRVMEERLRLLKRLAENDAERGFTRAAELASEKAAESEQHVNRLRKMLGDIPE
ncbi:chemotaxis protein CheB [Roseiconus nitratireducens]|uniref:protein-glutamate methylesterase n=1 Tax=Roseiconus nitratireducens TaxID=2605748 RepID=A0A5M6D1W3_9BACT|nr:chemotaxis protein CheB [Roseiconus nitratireducens]KAA5541323.1 chemotaxis protein CheB [Roseiconus nitratireducens]